MSRQRRTPRLIPAIDVMCGVVVHAIGGRREEYRPVKCPYTGSGKPYDVASALLQMAGANELYIADLDAITDKSRASPDVNNLLEMLQVPTWLDAGIGRTRMHDLSALPHVRPVVGFETCGSPDVLHETAHSAGTRPFAFSIDLKLGRLLGDWQAWGLDDDRDALGLARLLVSFAVRTFIVLDLARVGTGTGPGTEPLLKAIRHECPSVEIIAGGGVKTWADVDALGEAGADAVLVASALHNGTLTFPRPAL